MKYTMWNIANLVFILAHLSPLVSSSFDDTWKPNYYKTDKGDVEFNEVFEGYEGAPDHFKLLTMEEDAVYVGARNRLYRMPLADITNPTILEWPSDEASTRTCHVISGREVCDNFIRVVVKRNETSLFVCGTHSYVPKCRDYETLKNGEIVRWKHEFSGIGISPYSPDQNSTYIYYDEKMYSATVGQDSVDPLILLSDTNLNSRPNLLRTRTPSKDSVILNDPDFLSSFERDDKIFFFFREMATEFINCGKAVFSRVASVCKNDTGKARNGKFNTFFKARLNCSIPGEFPFYFDEMQATSELGQGNYRPTRNSGDRSDMMYGVFKTPQNSFGLGGSAVCAFRYSDIEASFKGRFKEQKDFKHNWLPVREEDTPKPHPAAKCSSEIVTDRDTLDFMKTHHLMDKAVPASGGMPVLVFPNLDLIFTAIAVDYQVLAADGKYYDIMFVGTDNGRIIKAINKGTRNKADSVVIEEIQVLDSHHPVTSLRVITTDTVQKLLVVSREQILTIPLHRCERMTTCSDCVGLQDPYCAWNSNLKMCLHTDRGLQNISSGKHRRCPAEQVRATSPPPSCHCPAGGAYRTTIPRETDVDATIKPPTAPFENQVDNKDEIRTAASKTGQAGGTAIEIVVTIVIVAIILSLVLGFFIGFKFQSCRYARDRDNVFERNCSSLQRGRNRLSSGDNPYFHTDQKSLTPKQMNYFVNMKNGKANTGVETQPVTKSNKVYL